MIAFIMGVRLDVPANPSFANYDPTYVNPKGVLKTLAPSAFDTPLDKAAKAGVYPPLGYSNPYY